MEYVDVVGHDPAPYYYSDNIEDDYFVNPTFAPPSSGLREIHPASHTVPTSFHQYAVSEDLSGRNFIGNAPLSNVGNFETLGEFAEVEDTSYLGDSTDSAVHLGIPIASAEFSQSSDPPNPYTYAAAPQYFDHPSSGNNFFPATQFAPPVSAAPLESHNPHLPREPRLSSAPPPLEFAGSTASSRSFPAPEFHHNQLSHSNDDQDEDDQSCDGRSLLGSPIHISEADELPFSARRELGRKPVPKPRRPVLASHASTPHLPASAAPQHTRHRSSTCVPQRSEPGLGPQFGSQFGPSFGVPPAVTKRPRRHGKSQSLSNLSLCMMVSDTGRAVVQPSPSLSAISKPQSPKRPTNAVDAFSRVRRKILPNRGQDETRDRSKSWSVKLHLPQRFRKVE